jgi:hypothetical protein
VCGPSSLTVQCFWWNAERFGQSTDCLELRLDALFLDGLHGGWAQPRGFCNRTNRREAAPSFVLLVGFEKPVRLILKGFGRFTTLS